MCNDGAEITATVEDEGADEEDREHGGDEADVEERD
jgi:hypothetical protein